MMSIQNRLITVRILNISEYLYVGELYDYELSVLCVGLLIYRRRYTTKANAKRGALRFLSKLTASAMASTIAVKTVEWVKS